MLKRDPPGHYLRRAWDEAFEVAMAEASDEADLARRLGELARRRPAGDAEERREDGVLGRIFWPYAQRRQAGGLR